MWQYANSWRTGPDHHDNWDSTELIIEHNAGLSEYAGKQYLYNIPGIQYGAIWLMYRPNNRLEWYGFFNDWRPGIFDNILYKCCQYGIYYRAANMSILRYVQDRQIWSIALSLACGPWWHLHCWYQLILRTWATQRERLAYILKHCIVIFVFCRF